MLNLSEMKDNKEGRWAVGKALVELIGKRVLIKVFLGSETRYIATTITSVEFIPTEEGPLISLDMAFTYRDMGGDLVYFLSWDREDGFQYHQETRSHHMAEVFLAD
jgi:hypothetical protein